MKFIKYTVLLFSANSFLFSCNYSPPETFLIPEGYKGNIYVVYKQKNGEKEEFEKGRRIYRIPNTGVLFSQFKDDYGIIDQEYYYISSKGIRTKLGILDTRDFNEEWTLEKNPHEPSRDSLAIFNPATTGVMGNSSDINSIKYQETCVGTYNDLKNFKEFSIEYIDSLRKRL